MMSTRISIIYITLTDRITILLNYPIRMLIELLCVFRSALLVICVYVIVFDSLDVTTLARLVVFVLVLTLLSLLVFVLSCEFDSPLDALSIGVLWILLRALLCVVL